MKEWTKNLEESKDKCEGDNANWNEKYIGHCWFPLRLLYDFCYTPLEERLKPCDHLFDQGLSDIKKECQWLVDAQEIKPKEIEARGDNAAEYDECMEEKTKPLEESKDKCEEDNEKWRNGEMCTMGFVTS